ncbi:MAG: hypothetical protein ACOYL6_01325 [Bacteriovoracaceae bacterium]
MLARKEQTTMGTQFPKEWQEEVTNLLKSTYLQDFKDDPRTFSVFGFTFPDEILIIVSFADDHSADSSPITLFISVDTDESTKIKPLLSKLIDASGVFFDQVLTEKNYDDPDLYAANWQDGENNGQGFFFKVSRENVKLTFEATKLLAESGFYIDDDSEGSEH